MLKGLLFIIVLIIIIAAIILLIAVNFVLSIVRRIRKGGYDYDDNFDEADNVRRHSNQYSFRGTTTSYSHSRTTNNQRANQQEIIVDTRDAHVANRQIIADDEGEYVDFVEEK